MRDLRISVTDRCNFRCPYCMPAEIYGEAYEFLPRADILTFEELTRLVGIFAELGIVKLRITGGEPLVRRNIISLFEALGRHLETGALDELTVTTNGSQLDRLAGPLSDAGVKRINVSLDSLDDARFRSITRTGDLSKVLRGIEAARAAGFQRLKLNTVILKHRNEDEILDLVSFVVARGMDISFIEEMPLGLIDDHDRALAYYSSDQVRRDIETRYRLIPTTETTGGPARYYRVGDTDSRVGFISPHSHNFCESCNRVRVTVQGSLLLCLGQEHSVDLRHVLRAHPGDKARLGQAIVDSMAIKPKGHDFDLSRQVVIMRHMSVTGG